TGDDVREQLNSDRNVVERTETKIVESTIQRSNYKTANCGSCAHSKSVIGCEHRVFLQSYG
ncbi:hypothetical protein PENTCL1PPCAC_9182, partial [Pristionchus entomophagus]